MSLVGSANANGKLEVGEIDHEGGSFMFEGSPSRSKSINVSFDVFSVQNASLKSKYTICFGTNRLFDSFINLVVHNKAHTLKMSFQKAVLFLRYRGQSRVNNVHTGRIIFNRNAHLEKRYARFKFCGIKNCHLYP